MLKQQAAAIDATDSATGPETAGSLQRHINKPTKTVSLIRSAPSIISLQQDVPMEIHPNEESNVNDNPLEDIIEVLNYFEYEQKSQQVHTHLQVKGSLKNNIQFWRSIGAPKDILSIIDVGYQIPFVQQPPSVNLQNNKSALTHSEFVNQVILELLQSDRIKEVSDDPVIVNPLSVSVQPNSKKRLILDLRHVNKFFERQN